MSSTNYYEVEVEIAGQWILVGFDFTYTPGCPEQGPSYASGGEPATGPEVEIQKATLQIVDGEKKEKVEAPPWLMAIFHADDDLHGTLAENFEDNDGPDPDAAYDARRDEG